jgi:localization factor PodJL
MQPDLPWNVAGIPPEAREAARAAARREGLSVGEWLTRRILKSFGDLGDTQADNTGRESWRSNAPAPSYRVPQAEPAPTTQGQDTQDMLAHVSRTENETHGVYRRIEEQMRTLTRRLDSTERSQSENGRAMSKAAAEINVAAREQAQAFDQLGGHVVGLNERLARVERSTSNDGLRDAVKGLHQGLSRLADQISETATQSATQIASLANNVESVAGRLNDARGEAEHISRSLDQRIAAMDERVRAVERAAHASASALEKTVESLEATHSSKTGEVAEIQRQAAALAHLNDTIDKLSGRFSASEAQNAGAMARLEENVAKLEARGAETGIDRRLQSIEHALGDIASRLESTEQKSAGAGSVEENLRTLAARVDAADKRHREALGELRTVVKEASGRLEPEPAAAAILSPAFAPQAAPPATTQPAAPLTPPPFAGATFDLPPFPDQAQHAAADPFTPPPPAGYEPQYAYAPPEQNAGGGHAFGADAFAATAAEQAGAAGTESYLNAARRSARAAAAAQAEQTARSPFAGFSWGFAKQAEPEKSSGGGAMRYLLIGGIALLVMAAVIAGVFLSHSLGGSTPHTPPNLPPIFQARPTGAETAPSAPVTQSVTPSATDDESNATVPPAASATVPHQAPSSPKISETAKPHALQPTLTKPSAAQPAAPPMTPLQRLAVLANGGSVKGELLLGMAYLDGQGTAVNEAEAARWLERAASQGDAIAQYRLGTLYERGHGVPADAVKATQLYGAAAKLGNRKAMHNLAVAYAEGNGVKKDLAQAAQWFTRAADLGLSDSEFNLAVLYERGMGVQQSLTDAYKWYAIAAAQGDTESKARIDALATQLSTDDKDAAARAAAAFKPQPMDRAANTPPDASAVLGG